jgi:hypothetical protein
MIHRPGFNLTGLRLVGPGVSPAELRFAPGLNVISGPSDTGKSFVLQCIDFLLGSGKLKLITEAARYDVGFLGLNSTLDGREYVLERGLRGGGFRLHAASLADLPDQDSVELGAKHKPGREDTVSGFLLGLSGVFGKLVRTNKRGKTRQISFRDLARLTLVDEKRIISEESPMHTGQYTLKTVEESVFRLLLTGIDDSGVIEDKDDAVSRSRRNAQVEVVDQLITELREELSALAEAPDDRTLSALQASLADITERFAAASEVLSGDQHLLSVAEENRKQAWTTYQRCASRIAVLDGLLSRFTLLDEHYRSDLSRLEAIAEAGFVLEQFPVERCPLCGAPHDWQDHEHAGHSDELARIREACLGESQRILALIHDLQATIAETHREKTEVEDAKSEASTALDASNRTIREEIEPRVRASAGAIHEIQAKRDRLLRGLDLAERIAALEERRCEISEGSPPSPDEPEQPRTLGAAEIEVYCAVVEDLLRSWRYPDLTRVVFSDTEHDLVISGRHRASHGKGIRAISHAAFIIGFLRYCVDKGLPHPATVVLDSPLVAYRAPDVPPEERFGPEVKASFYTSLAAGTGGGQIIVLENEDPPPSILRDINYIHFTKSEEGRYGFIPV